MCGGFFDWDATTKRLAELNEAAEDPNLWDDPTAAQKMLKERQRYESNITGVLTLEKDLADAIDLIELAEMEGETELLDDAQKTLKILHKTAGTRQAEALLSGEADGNDAYLEIHPGAGGTESQDWASIMLRMYVRWAERSKYKVEIIEEQAGEEAGIKSATILVKGLNSYGKLKTESGVHRLVRISPFDSNARRHTSFSSVWVYPVVDDNIEVNIAESECRIDTYRASGAGGQHVNTTDSAVRITHLPTGIMVSCQMGRSQHKNKETAWQMLRARIYEMELKKREDAANAQNASKSENGWGHQIRSYVMQPYQMVKDLRTGVVSSSPSDVQDGDLDAFIEAALAYRVTGQKVGDTSDVD